LLHEIIRTSTFQSAYELETYQKHRLYLVMGMVILFWIVVAVIDCWHCHLDPRSWWLHVGSTTPKFPSTFGIAY
jgi:hypothetical protein